MFKFYKTIAFVVSATLLISISGCSLFDNEKSIYKDKKEQKEITEGLFATYWKGAKISIRSIPIDENTKTIDFEKIKLQQAKDLNLGKHLSRIYDWENILTKEKKAQEQQVSYSAKEFLEFATEIYNMSKTIDKIDEDSYPTFAKIIQHSSRVLDGESIELPIYWNNSMDHWLFAISLESNLGLSSWKTYELAKVNPQELVTSDYRIWANFHKGIDHLRNKWYFLSDESFSQAIAETNKAEITLQEPIKNLIKKAQIKNLSPQEQFRRVSRASAYLFRGFSRHQADANELNEKALKDVESALGEFHELGIENELVWIAESYMYIENEEKEKALVSLTKLQDSKFLTSKEKILIKEAKNALNNRDSNSALNILTDKVIIYNLGLNYTKSYTQEIQWMQLLEKTEQGREILKRFKELEQMYEKAKNYIDFDMLDGKAGSLLKSING